MNKKLLALLLAILMVAMSAVAMAGMDSNNQISISAGTAFFELTKTYVDSDGESVTVFPAEAITLEKVSGPTFSQAEVENPTAPTLEFVAKVDASSDPWNGIKLSNFASAGVFTWTIKEANLGTAGVTYDDKVYTLSVAVGHNPDSATATQTPFIPLYVKIADASNTKIDSATLTNTFKTGTLEITKDITGDLSVASDVFPVTVVLTSAKPVLNTIQITDSEDYGSTTAPTAAAAFTKGESDTNYTSTTTVYVTDNSKIVLSNIPEGVSYSVTEDGVTEGKVTKDGRVYTVSYGTATTGTIANGGTSSVAITNNATATVDTGVSTDTMPYILLMAFVAILAVAFVAKKRSVNE